MKRALKIGVLISILLIPNFIILGPPVRAESKCSVSIGDIDPPGGLFYERQIRVNVTVSGWSLPENTSDFDVSIHAYRWNDTKNDWEYYYGCTVVPLPEPLRTEPYDPQPPQDCCFFIVTGYTYRFDVVLRCSYWVYYPNRHLYGLYPLVIESSEAHSGNRTITYNFVDKPPITASFTMYPTKPKIGDTITFTSTSTCRPDKKITEYAWFLNDWSNPILGSVYQENVGNRPSWEWTPTKEGTYTVRLAVADNTGLGDWTKNRDKYNITFTIGLVPTRIEIIYPPRNFTVLTVDAATFWGDDLHQELVVKVIDATGKGVSLKDVFLEATITPPSTLSTLTTFEPTNKEEGEYFAVWEPRTSGSEPSKCTITVTATVPTTSGKFTASESVEGTVDPKIEITDIKPIGAYHKKGPFWFPARDVFKPWDNSYDPLWDDIPIDPSDDDYVCFRYELNKDVDAVTISEYKYLFARPDQMISCLRYTRRGDKEYISKGFGNHYMNVKDLDKGDYYIRIGTIKIYDLFRHTGVEKYREEGDQESKTLTIERKDFARVHVEKTANVKTGTIPLKDFLNEELRKQYCRTWAWATGSVLVSAITSASGAGFWLSVFFDGLESYGGLIYETWFYESKSPGFIDDDSYEGLERPGLFTSMQDRALAVRFTTRVFEWKEDRYIGVEDDPEYGGWLDHSEFIYADIYRRQWDEPNKDPNAEIWDSFTGKSATDLAFCTKGGGIMGARSRAASEIDLRYHSSWTNNWLGNRWASLNDFNLPNVFSVPEKYRPEDLAPGKLDPKPAAAAYKDLNEYYKRYYIESYTSLPTLYRGEVGDPSNFFHEGVTSSNTKKTSYSTTDVQAQLFTVLFSTAESDEVFTGSYSDYGTDTDGNGLYDYLTIEVGVDVAEPGDYMLQGTLGDSDGTLLVWAYNYTHLALGSHILQLQFNGMSIFQNLKDEPYILTHLLLVDENGEIVSHEINFTDGLYSTSSYGYKEFERPNISFNDEYSDSGTDINGDGFFDYLTVDVGVNVGEAGDYRVFGWLSIDGVLYIAGTGNAIYFDAGIQNILLDFDGRAIRLRELGGPFSLNLEVCDEKGNILDHRYDAFQTSSYTKTEFQRPPAQFSGKYSDHGTDTDGDGLYDYLTVNTEVIIDKTGNYTIFGRLETGDGALVASETEYLVLEAGTQRVQLNFDGVYIRQHGVDGAFNVSALIFDESGSTETGEYTTSMYDSTAFETASAKFNDVFFDGGDDTDGDGFFDVLKLEVGVDVVEAGDFVVSGLLYDKYGDYVESASSYQSLEKGGQTVQLIFDGQKIREHGVNGAYSLTDLTLYDESGKQIDYQDIAYATSTYSSSNFQPPLVEFNDVFSDYGTDEDGDGEYDCLTVDVGVAVTTPGNYSITGRLDDRYGNYTVWTASHIFLDVGTRTVQLNFDVETIRQHGVDGSYKLSYLELYNSKVREIDRRKDVYTTSAYSFLKEALTVVDHLLCKNIDDEGRAEGVTTTFTSGDVVFSWLSVSDASIGDEVWWLFQGPNYLARDSMYTLDWSGEGYRYAFLDLSGYDPEMVVGLWNVTVYVNGEVASTAYFEVKATEGFVLSAQLTRVEAPSEVMKDERLTVSLTVDYDFSVPTEVSPGIYDIDGEEWIAEEYETLEGRGSKTYSFTLTAPSAETTWELESSVWYNVGGEWLHDETGWHKFFDVEVTGEGCMIATATFESELAPEVQFLRGFRENIVLKTFTGRQFMQVFNAWYYSFSPGVAAYIAQQPIVKGVMKAVFYPLIWILHLSSMTYSVFDFAPELGVAMTGLVASLMMGAVYFSIPIALLLALIKRIKEKTLRKSQLKTMLIPWTMSVIAMILGEAIPNKKLIGASTIMFVLTTLSTSALALGIIMIEQIPGSVNGAKVRLLRWFNFK